MDTNTFIILGMICAVLTPIFNYIGNSVAKSDREERIKVLESNKLKEIQEAYGVMSKRTVSEFVYEKIPEDLSISKGKDLISKGVERWLSETSSNLNLKFEMFDPEKSVKNYSFSDNESQEIVFQAYYNYNVQADNANVYFDVFTQDLIAGPEPPIYYVHVLVNSDPEDLSESTCALLLKYKKWFVKAKSLYKVGMNWHKHIIIVVLKDWKGQWPLDTNMLNGQLDAYIHSQGQPVEGDYQIIVYKAESL